MSKNLLLYLKIINKTNKIMKDQNKDLLYRIVNNKYKDWIFSCPQTSTFYWNEKDWDKWILKHGHKIQRFYVCMTDKFMSGWGCADGKINKFIIECETKEEAIQIKYIAHKRPEMKYINIHTKMPNYNHKKYLVSLKKFNELGSIWTGLNTEL
tara:strand:- start:3210 stop:3668 length:459 start_codon:yes stop_codon:yes gene_type:complete